MEIRKVTKAWMEQAIALCFERNNQLEHRSMYEYVSHDKIEADVKENQENIYVAVEDQILCGCMNCFPDEEQKTVDCSIFTAEGKDFEVIARNMITYVSTQVYGVDHHYNFFFPKENEEYHALMENLNANDKGNEYCLLLEKADFKDQIAEKEEIQLLNGAEEAQFMNLHDEIFPEVYITGKDIVLSSHQKTREIYVIKNNDRIDAYGVLHLSQGKRMTAEIFGVREGCRGMGLGRKVLTKVCRQGFEVYQAEQMDLIVDCDNERALVLYTDVGFKVEYENHAYTYEPKERE